MRPALLASLVWLGVLLAPPQLPAQQADPPSADPAKPVEPEAVHPLARIVSRSIHLLESAGVTFEEPSKATDVIECVARLADPRSRILDRAALEREFERRSGRVRAPDIRLSVSNGVALVAASKTRGLQAGDRVIAIDGFPTTNITLGVALERLRAPANGPITLLVQRELSVVTAVAERVEHDLPAIEVEERWPRQIGYLRVNGFFEGRSDSVLETLRAWEAAGLSGGILDLRGANGDDLEAVVRLAAPFASPGSLLFTLRDRYDNDLERRLAPGETAPLKIPIMALVDESTTGAAEVFAATAADSLRGILVIGRSTAADPLIREAVPLGDDQLLYIATRRMVTGNGAVFDGTAGVFPNIAVEGRPARPDYEPDPAEDRRRQRLEEEVFDRALRDRVRGDPILQRALDVLLGLKALNIRVT